MPTNLSHVRRAADRFGVKIPQAVEVAQAARDAAEAQRQRAAEVTPPDLTRPTTDTIEELIRAQMGYAARHARIDATTAVAAAATNALRVAVDAAVPQWLEDFRGPFTDAARRFTEAVEQLGPLTGNADEAIKAGKAKARKQMLEAGDELTELIQLRDELAAGAKAEVGDNHAEQPTRMLALAEIRNLRSLAIVVTAPRGSLDWLLQVVGIPGVELAWHTPAEQVEHVAALRRTKVPA